VLRWTKWFREEEVCGVSIACFPSHFETTLPDSVSDPVEAQVHRPTPALLYRIIRDAYCTGIVTEYKGTPDLAITCFSWLFGHKCDRSHFFMFPPLFQVFTKVSYFAKFISIYDL
jgi:hypothetical protein